MRISTRLTSALHPRNVSAWRDRKTWKPHTIFSILHVATISESATSLRLKATVSLPQTVGSALRGTGPLGPKRANLSLLMGTNRMGWSRRGSDEVRHYVAPETSVLYVTQKPPPPPSWPAPLLFSLPRDPLRRYFLLPREPLRRYLEIRGGAGGVCSTLLFLRFLFHPSASLGRTEHHPELKLCVVLEFNSRTIFPASYSSAFICISGD